MSQSNRFVRRYRRIGGVFACALVAYGCEAQIADPVQLEAGLVSVGDVTPSGVRVYRGLPFAAPPVGDNRWRAPQPVEAWDGVRDGSEFGNVCIQADTQPRYINIANMDGSPALSEDCLYLNVWTAAESPSDRLPVMVFFYGGAFTDGGGAPPLYDGTALAERGAVVVTMNYRLGSFGFFAHPALTAESGYNSSGNYGILDMVASLEWVQANIAALGGDPDNVTVFGQSAGAMAITSLMTSPLAEGLFQRAIAQSIMGGGASPNGRNATLAAQEEAGAQAAERAGLATLAAMRALPADEVLTTLRANTMIVDNYVIPEDPAIVFAEGRHNKVDVLMGGNFADLAFGGGGPPDPANNASDRVFWVARRIADYAREAGQEAWVYWFARNGAGSEEFLPVHASEVKYVFDNLGEIPLFPDASDAELIAASADDQRLADQVASYWVNFARTGNPNGSGLPDWPAHTGLDQINAAILDSDPTSTTLPTAASMQALDEQLEVQLETLAP
jgi:para-nitrobenzyl esterase